MVLPNHLQQLHDLDRTLSQLHEQLSDFFRTNEYRDAVRNLKGEDLAWFIEYLRSVSFQTVTPHSALSTGVGSCRYFRLCKCPAPGTRKVMRCRDVTGIVQASSQTFQYVPEGELREGCGGTFSMSHSPFSGADEPARSLPGSRGVERLLASKRRPTSWYRYGSPTTHFGLDARRELDRIYHEPPRYGQT